MTDSEKTEMTGRPPRAVEPRASEQRGAAGDSVTRGARARGKPGESGTGRAEAGEPPRARRVSRQREAGEATRRETRRRLLAAAKAEFAERGYAAATVIRIAERADVSV